jgi:hypothetical protein
MGIDLETRKRIFEEGLNNAIAKKNEIQKWIDQGVSNNTDGEDRIGSLLDLAENEIQIYTKLLSSLS